MPPATNPPPCYYTPPPSTPLPHSLPLRWPSLLCPHAIPSPSALPVRPLLPSPIAHRPPPPPGSFSHQEHFLLVLHSMLLIMMVNQFKGIRSSYYQAKDLKIRSKVARWRGDLEKEIRLMLGWNPERDNIYKCEPLPTSQHKQAADGDFTTLPRDTGAC